jgi:hypothetical protein
MYQVAETFIISPSVSRVRGTFVDGVFDNVSYSLMAIGLVIIFGILWASLQMEKHQKLTLKSPTLFEETI